MNNSRTILKAVSRQVQSVGIRGRSALQQGLRITEQSSNPQRMTSQRTMRSVAKRAVCVEGSQMPMASLTRTAESGLAVFFGFEEGDDGT